MDVSLEKKPKNGKPGKGGRLATMAAGVVGLVMVLTAACGPDTTKEPAPAPNVAAVKVNMDDLPSSDCWYEIGFRDEDGKLGGRKLTTIETVCP